MTFEEAEGWLRGRLGDMPVARSIIVPPLVFQCFAAAAELREARAKHAGALAADSALEDSLYYQSPDGPVLLVCGR